jgi:glyoxylate/hydroxypyruvate reductase
MSILLIGDFTEEEYATWYSHLLLHLPKNEALVQANDQYDKRAVKVALVANPPAGALSSLPNLRFIQSLWAGVDRLLTDVSLPPNVPIARLVDPAMTQAMVECAIAEVFYLHRQLPTYRKQQSDRTWRQLPQPLASERSVGVLGLGALGYPVARALAEFGFPVAGWSLHPRDVTNIESHHGVDGLARVANRSRILINLLPLTPRTTGILNGSLFQQLPIGAALMNLARGEHLVEQDLLTALDGQRLSHAVLDVFNTEPLPPNHPFWGHPRITVFPHVAAATDPATAARIAGDNIAAYLAGRDVSGLVLRSRGY